MAFVVTAFTLAQVADVEKQAAQEQDQTFLTEYRFVHTKLPSILSGNTGRTTDNLSFNSTFATTIASFRTNLAAKGYDAAIFLGGNGTSATKAECLYVASPGTACQNGWTGATWSSVTPLGGTEAFDSDLVYDGKSDGIVWMCGATSGVIVGAVVDVYVSDGRTSVQETLLVALNHDWYKAEVAKAPASRCQG